MKPAHQLVGAFAGAGLLATVAAVVTIQAFRQIEEAAEAVEHFVERMAEPAPKVEYELPPDAPVETSAAVLAPTPVPPEASAEKSR